jgi:hypothetical protein
MAGRRLLYVSYTERNNRIRIISARKVDGREQLATIITRRLNDGSYVELLPDGSTRPSVSKTDDAVLDAMTDEEITAAALSDPDAQPLTDEQLRRMRQTPRASALAAKVGTGLAMSECASV